MKRKTFFIIAIIFLIIGLIIAFENIQTSAQILILFKSNSQSLFFPFLLFMLIGIVSGFFFGLGHYAKDVKDEDLENTEF